MIGSPEGSLHGRSHAPEVEHLYEATPEDSRYVPFTQQPYCCVPTSIQMVMYKNGMPLVPAEEIGYHLGLVVPPNEAHFFYKVRTSTAPPPAGYGTRIYDSEFEPNKALAKLEIPLSLSVKPITEIADPQELVAELEDTENKNLDALLCFNHGALVDNKDMDWGHVVVFDRVVDGQLRIVDPSPRNPKWRLVTAQKMFEAMSKHGKTNAAGTWFLTKK